MAGITQLGYLGLQVSDLAAWRNFAADVLGLELAAPRADGAVPLRIDERSHRVLLHEGRADDVAYIGWEVADEAALDAMRTRLDRAQIAFREGTGAERAARGVREMIHFEDPDGIRTEVHCGPEAGPRAFASARMSSGFKTGQQGLGHVLVNVRDTGVTERFYRDVLGFRLSDYVDTDFMGHPIHAVFLHVNPRHHSLAFAALGQPKRLHHLMLEVNAIDDVGATFYRAQDLGVPIALTLGRHQNDRMVSFYGVTPSGFCFEVGTGGVEVHDEHWQVRTHGGVSDWGHRPLGAPPA